MSKEIRINSIIESIFDANAKNGTPITDRDAQRIRNIINQDFLTLDKDRIENGIAQDMSRYFSNLGYTKEEAKTLIPNFSDKFFDAETDTIINMPHGDACEVIASLYTIMHSIGYYNTPAKDNILTIDDFETFTSNYWLGKLAYNVVLGQIEFIGFPDLADKIDHLPTDDYRKNNLRIDYFVDISYKMLKKAYSGYTRDDLFNYMCTIADKNIYNPVVQMLQNNKWDGKDRLSLVYNYLQQTDDFKQTLVRKWLIQCVSMLFNDGTVGAEGCLTISGNQGVGKTAFFQNIVPNPHWQKSIETFDANNKDKIMKATSTWIGELSEVEDMYKRDQGALKAFITSPNDEYRKPYDRKSTKSARISSYGATVNRTDFISDDSARRWWVIEMHRPNTPQQINDLKDNAMQIWLQVYNIYLANVNGFRLTQSEREKIISNNNNYYQRENPYEEELKAMFDFENSQESTEKWKLKTIWDRLADDNIVSQKDNKEKRLMAATLKKLAKQYNIKSSVIDGYVVYCINERVF